MPSAPRSQGSRRPPHSRSEKPIEIAAALPGAPSSSNVNVVPTTGSDPGAARSTGVPVVPAQPRPYGDQLATTPGSYSQVSLARAPDPRNSTVRPRNRSYVSANATLVGGTDGRGSGRHELPSKIQVRVKSSPPSMIRPRFRS